MYGYVKRFLQWMVVYHETQYYMYNNFPLYTTIIQQYSIMRSAGIKTRHALPNVHTYVVLCAQQCSFLMYYCLNTVQTMRMSVIHNQSRTRVCSNKLYMWTSLQCVVVLNSVSEIILYIQLIYSTINACIDTEAMCSSTFMCVR